MRTCSTARGWSIPARSRYARRTNASKQSKSAPRRVCAKCRPLSCSGRDSGQIRFGFQSFSCKPVDASTDPRCFHRRFVLGRLSPHTEEQISPVCVSVTLRMAPLSVHRLIGFRSVRTPANKLRTQFPHSINHIYENEHFTHKKSSEPLACT